MSLLTGLRRLLHGSDVVRAMAAEKSALAADADRRRALGARLRAAFSVEGPSTVKLGTMVRSNEPVQLPARQLLGHAFIGGPSGCGKSYFLCHLLQTLLTSGCGQFSLWDPKYESVALVGRAVVDLGNTLPPAEAEKLWSRVVLISPFSTRTLPRLNVLAPEPGLDPELQAAEVASLITVELGMEVGVRQEALLHRAVECLIRASLPLTALPAILEEPSVLMALAETAGPAELFRATAIRLEQEPRERVLGLVARAERLLRLRSTRLALGGSQECIDFDRLLNESIALANLEPPNGSADVGKFICGLKWIKLQHAVRRRANGSSSTIIVLEEAPAFLAATGPRAADGCEDLLRLARAKGVFLYFLSQDLGASLGRVSSTLPDIIKNNAHWHAIFRTEDRSWDFALPVTGRRRAAPAAPWEEQRIKFLDRSAELALLRDELAKLPDRECLLLDRRNGLPAVRMRTADVHLHADADALQVLEARAQSSDMVASTAELERGLAEVEARLAALRDRRRGDGASTPPLPRRGRRPVDMG